MTKLIDKIQAAGARAWLTFIQQLNAIVMAAFGSAIVVHSTYPDVIRQLLSKLPPAIAAVCLFLFGFVVHYALRRAKTDAARG
jgi:hypothetical protein